MAHILLVCAHGDIADLLELHHIGTIAIRNIFSIIILH
jgi:hypothetical protein